MSSISTLFFLLLIPNIGHAYLDPASGSAILYLTITAITSLVFYSRSILVIGYAKLLAIFKRETNFKNEVVIYSEGKRYWNTFSPLLKEFIRNDKDILYLTSSKDDPAFDMKHPRLHVKYIGNQVLACSYLNYLTTKILITTTPQLNVFTFKKTKRISHYIHVVHAPIDLHTYRKFAFDYFDSVFCSGPHQIRSIRNLENIRGTQPKNLYKTGLLYYDEIKAYPHNNNKDINSNLKTILIAPTWKEYSLLNNFGLELIQKLLGAETYNIIFRPHPQSLISYKALTNKLISKCSKHPNFSVDLNDRPEKSISDSDLLISDLSGIVWDYIFTQEKPVLLFDTPQKLYGFEDTELPHTSWERELIKNHLTTFKRSDLQNINIKIDSALQLWDKSTLAEEKNRSIYNFKSAAPVAYKQIQSILENEFTNS